MALMHYIIYGNYIHGKATESMFYREARRKKLVVMSFEYQTWSYSLPPKKRQRTQSREDSPVQAIDVNGHHLIL